MPDPRARREPHLHLTFTQTLDRLAPPWHGLHTEIVMALQPPQFEYQFKFPCSLLMARGSEAGDGLVARDGLPNSALRRVHEWLEGPASPEQTLTQSRPVSRGGLSGWQRNKVADFIEDHLNEALRLSTLADLVSLSPYHFARAFKQSFGLPPHRYHLSRRIERAKTLLAEPERSVTDIARGLGFTETSSFSAAFRKVTGFSPRDWRRNFR